MGFTGAYTDAESGLLHLRARQYDTGTGRFLTRDPVEGGSCNDYDHVCGDPVNGIDPSGECIQVWQERCRGDRSIWAKGGRHVVRTIRSGGNPVLLAAQYGTVSVTGCAVACGSVSFSLSDGRARVGVGGAFCCSLPGASVTWSPGSIQPGYSGSSTGGGCYVGCVGFGATSAWGSGSVSRTVILGVGTRGSWLTPMHQYGWDLGPSPLDDIL